ncbi:MAG: hypothetical protein DI598_09890 [Pseudopedobacter saltans]|uniref:Uncharacterized protein n=1 Tax=Pseudopedobacter saltans TaxID=151895 RepID=A0A2W5EWS2_9SPHI|nr:MAG: hypothetical protein DI598_09890 [Pseudopedobacter saltans]
MRRSYTSIVSLSFLLFVFVSAFKAKPALSIDGVWKVTEVQTIKPDGTITAVFPLESQIIFAKNYYSFCWTSHHSPKQSWQIPDSIKLARFNQSIVNAGSYELKDSVLTTKATFAMSPMFTNGVATFKCYFSHDTLFLNGINVLSANNVPNPIYANGSHFLTKLVKIK